MKKFFSRGNQGFGPRGKRNRKGADFFLTFAFLNKLENPFFFLSFLETLFYS